MEQLDLVYKAFTNLDKSYARSNKTRSEFIESKFGGDINTGIFLILKALSSCELTDPEDVRKFSEVRTIFESIQKHIGHLDSLKDFSFKDEDFATAFISALNTGDELGMGIKYVTQEELYTKNKALHYKAGADTVIMSPIGVCSVFKTFNDHIRNAVENNTSETDVQYDELFRLRGDRFIRIDSPKFD